MLKVLDNLSFIGEKLNSEGVFWAVGASLLLNHYGFIDKPNDIDILVDLKDIERTDKILKNIGEKKVWEKAQTYSTKYFYEYTINGFDVDVMSGLAINHKNGVFNYIFDQSSISGFKKFNGIDIPLTSLEDWYVIYQLIPNREMKVTMIENYLKLNGIKKANLLKRALTLNLSYEVRENIERMLNNYTKR